MTKKSLFALSSGLVISGLLLVWSANAIKYTIEWNTTTVKIPTTPSDNQIIINWWNWDENTTQMTSCPTKVIANGVEWYECTYTYPDTDERTVQISNQNNVGVDTIYIASWNLKTITDFSQFDSLSTIYINDNNLTTINNNAFNWILNGFKVHLNNNYMTDFSSPIGNITHLYMMDNELTTIPTNIWNSRLTHIIHLDSETSLTLWSNNSKHIYLNNETTPEPNNKIIFVWITKIGSTNNIDTIENWWYEFTSYPQNWYNFERFGYSYKNNSLTYDYEIEGVDGTEKIGHSSTSADINIPLYPNSYTFKVCIHDTNNCDSVNFTVSYTNPTLSLDMDPESPNPTQDITFNRILNNDYYPENLIKWYKFYLNGIDITEDIAWDNYTTGNSATILNHYNYLDQNGTNTFTVKLFNNIEQEIADATENFSISQWTPTITIQSPSPESTEIKTAEINFTWAHNIPSRYTFHWYEYNVECIEQATCWTYSHNSNEDTNLNNESYSWFSLYNLPDGRYIFNINMYYNNDSQYVSDQRIFKVSASEWAYITINLPSNWNTYSIWNITPTWEWGNSTLATRYHYKLTNTDTSEVKIEWNINKNDNDTYEINTQTLSNWHYKFEVDMLNSDNQPIISESSIFMIDITPTIRIDKPEDSESNNIIQFAWTPTIPEGCEILTTTPYTYTVKEKNSGNIIKSSDWTADTSFEMSDLNVQTKYTFEVTMKYKKDRFDNWASTFSVTKSKDFTMGGNAASLSINSPEDWDDLIDSDRTKKTVTFKWTWWGTQFHHYKYNLTKQWTTIPLLTEADGKTNPTDTDDNEFTYDLPNGRYTFTVEMYNSSSNNPIKSESSTFTVTIPSRVEIQSPATGSSIPSATTAFTWTWFTPYTCLNYEYIVTWPNDYFHENSASCSTTWFELRNLRDWTYTFKIRMKYNDWEDKYTDYVSSTFTVNSSTNKYLNITSPRNWWIYTPANGINYSWNYKVPVTFTWNWWGSALIEKYSYKIIDSNSHEILSDTINKNNSWEYSINQSLSKWSYTFEVNMLDSDGASIMKQTNDFKVSLPARIAITSPKKWDTITSSSTKFTWTWYADILTKYEYSLTNTEWYSYNWFGTNNSFSRNDLTNWNYTLTVRLSSEWQTVATNTINFTVSIPKKSSWWWGWSSSKTHYTNNLDVSINNEKPKTNEWVEVTVNIDDKYNWKVDFTKMQYYSTEDEKWVDIPVTSKNYVSDYWDDAKLGYVKFDSSDDGEKELSDFVKFSQPGNYRIYAEDKDWYNDYVQFYVWKWNNNTIKSTNTTTSTPTDTEDEVFIARSCKKYKITYSSSLNVYSSPNLNMSEYFMNKDYFKRYIDSKNRYQDGCPTNIWWISTSYYDKTNDNTRYTAPNGKVYFITWQEWNYYSDELNKELKTPTSFSTIQQLKYYIRDRNPLINMATLWPVS